MYLNQKKRIVIIGATSSIAEHCARIWTAAFAVDFILVSRDFEKTELIAQDLKTRNPESTIQNMQVDFESPEKIQELTANIFKEGNVDIVLIAHGMLSDQRKCEVDLLYCYESLSINAISPILFAESFVSHMEEINKGTLAIIGSVAGDRGRKSNYVYGAAKGFIEHYVQGLQHRLSKTDIRVVLIKPGPTDTPMTAHLKTQGVSLASVETVASLIVKGIAQRKPMIYVPGKWRVIMMIIRNLPWFIFKKMDI